jgi:hypothetical protein
MSDSKIRLRQAQKFLLDHPEEKNSTAARIYKVHEKTLSNAILRAQRACNRPNGGQNKILSKLQEQAIHGFIQSYLEHNQLPTREVIFAAICNLRERNGTAPPSQDWLSRWWKRNGLHKIKTKPLARVRITAQDIMEVDHWFDGPNGYLQAIKKYTIVAKDCHNFDETGFRVGCPRGVEVLVPLDIKEVYINLYTNLFKR